MIKVGAKMPKRKRNKKWISWMVVLLLLVMAITVSYLLLNNYFSDEKKDDHETELIDVERVEKTEIGEDQNDDDNNIEKKKVEQYDGDDPNNSSELSGVVTYASVQNGKLMIRVNIDQYLADGKCELTLKRGGATIYSSIANIAVGASTATCEGFDVPVADLEGGKVDIVINLNADSRTGVIRGEANI